MDSCASMNYQYQQFESQSWPSQAPAHLPQATSRNMQTGTVNAAYHNMPLNSGVWPAQNNGYTRWIYRPVYQRILPKQKSAQMTNSNHWNANYQSRKPHPLQGSSIFQAATGQNSPQTSAHHALTPGESMTMRTNLQSLVHLSSDYTPKAAPFQPVVHSNTLVSPNDYYHRQSQNSIQNGFPESVPPPNYHSVCQSQISRRIRGNQSEGQEPLAFSRMSQPAQQDLNHFSYSNQSENSQFVSKATELPSAPSAGSKEQIIARIERYLRESSTAHIDTQSTTCNNTADNTRQSVSNVGTLRDASRLMPENLSKAQRRYLILKQIVQKMLGVLPSDKANDGSIHSSPGCTETRNVAVVQPLAQESQLNKGNSSTSEIGIQVGVSPTKIESFSCSQLGEINSEAPDVRDGSNCIQENPMQMCSEKSNISCVSASGASGSSSSDSAEQQDSQKHACACDTGPNQAGHLQVDLHVSLTAHITSASKEPESQSGDVDINPSDLAADFIELAKIQTVPYTAVRLQAFVRSLLQDNAHEDLTRDPKTVFSLTQLLKLFWDGKRENCRSSCETGWFTKLIHEINEFCRDHVTPDTVVLSEVQRSQLTKLCGHHVLKHDEVYAEPPYKSLWLNVNEQLDDIDKEFGFPWPLRRHPCSVDSDILLDQAETLLYISDRILSEDLNEGSPKTELESDDSCQEQPASPDEAASPQTASPNKSECANSSDPFYSFEIQVLPQEEAKVIFEKVTMDTLSQPEGEVNTSMKTKLLEEPNVSENNSKPENKPVHVLEEVCCTEKFMQNIQGSSTALRGYQCQNKISPNESPDRDKMTGLQENKLHGMESDSESSLAKVGESVETSGENINKQVIIFIETVDQSEDDDARSISRLINCLREVPDHATHLEKDFEQAKVKPTGNIQSTEATEVQPDSKMDCEEDQSEHRGTSLICSLVQEDEEGYQRSRKTDMSSRKSEQEETCIGTQQVSTEVSESPAHTGAALQNSPGFSPSPETVVRQRKRLHDHNRLFNVLKKLKKSVEDVDSQSLPEAVLKDDSVDTADGEPSASLFRNVKLALFGSLRQNKCDVTVGRKSHYSSPNMSSLTQRAPSVLSLRLSPLKKKSVVETSVKIRIHKEWSKSFVATGIRHRDKSKGQKTILSSLWGPSEKKAETPGSLERRSRHCDNKGMMKRSCSKKPKHREKMKRGEGDQRLPPDQKTLQESLVPKFRMLPKTLSFTDRPHRTKVPNEAASEKPDRVQGKNSKKSGLKGKAQWDQRSEKTSCSLRPKSSGLFKEFQKKQKKLSQQC